MDSLYLKKTVIFLIVFLSPLLRADVSELSVEFLEESVEEKRSSVVEVGEASGHFFSESLFKEDLRKNIFSQATHLPTEEFLPHLNNTRFTYAFFYPAPSDADQEAHSKTMLEKVRKNINENNIVENAQMVDKSYRAPWIDPLKVIEPGLRSADSFKQEAGDVVYARWDHGPIEYLQDCSGFHGLDINNASSSVEKRVLKVLSGADKALNIAHISKNNKKIDQIREQFNALVSNVLMEFAANEMGMKKELGAQDQPTAIYLIDYDPGTKKIEKIKIFPEEPNDLTFRKMLSDFKRKVSSASEAL